MLLWLLWLLWLCFVVVVVCWVCEPLAAFGCRDVELERLEREAWCESQEVHTSNEKQQQAPMVLSVVIPAYNEALRLPSMLEGLAVYLNKRKRRGVEVLVVDDGSSDDTSGAALEAGKRLFAPGDFRVARLAKNRGKGAAVREGAQRARGQWILLADADGATKIEDLDRLEKRAASEELKKPVIVVGSRAHLEKSEAVAKRSPLRNVLMRGFQALVKIVGGVRNVRDTQCGFKLFNRAALPLLKNLHLERWAFDVELLFLAQCEGAIIAEVPVTWSEIPGSKLSLLKDSLKMARDIACFRIAYKTGLWQRRPADFYKEDDKKHL